jgi:hypothetical protein
MENTLQSNFLLKVTSVTQINVFHMISLNTFHAGFETENRSLIDCFLWYITTRHVVNIPTLLQPRSADLVLKAISVFREAPYRSKGPNAIGITITVFIFHSEEDGSNFLRNIAKYLLKYTISNHESP